MIAAAAALAITVCAQCAHADLQATLVSAAPHATITVAGGTQHGPFFVRKPVTLVGVGGAVLDGGGSGTVVNIASPDVSISGFTIRNGGASLTALDAGVGVNAAEVVVKNNRIEESTFGIVVGPSSGVRLDGNSIAVRTAGIGSPSLRGDGIRAYRSPGISIEDNVVSGVRDVVVLYSDGAQIVGNRFSNSRYCLHDMYSDHTRVSRNTFSGCEIGSNYMYASHAVIDHDLFAHDRGATGYGVGLESMDDVAVVDDAFVDDRVGVMLNESPSTPGATVKISGDVFAYDGAGVAAMPVTTGAIVSGNTFVDNLEQVAVLGSGTLSGIRWDDAGRGNYWSDYAGYDADGDRIGDVAYAPAGAYAMLADENPDLSIFAYSPAQAALDFATRALPAFAPAPRLVDEHPLMEPVEPTDLPRLASDGRARTGFWLASLLAFGSIAGLFAMLAIPARDVLKPNGTSAPAVAPVPSRADKVIVARTVGKRYGRRWAVRDATFEITPGESVALWGPNGAGKTTLLRCFLGLISFEGDLEIFGRRPSLGNPAARTRIGYVPQRLPQFEMTVGELASLVAGLKAVSRGEVDEMLARFGLTAERKRPVAILSGGMQQRLALGLALLGSPALLLLDEPAASLDRKTRLDLVQRLARERERGVTLVFSSHAADDVELLATRVIVLGEGSVVADMASSSFNSALQRGDLP